MIKILHLSTAMDWGGNEQVLVDLIAQLELYETQNWVLCHKDSPIEKYCLANGLRHLSYKKVKAYDKGLLQHLRNLCDTYNFDVLHMHTSNSLTTYVVADLLHKLSPVSIYSRKGLLEGSTPISRLKYNYRGLDAIICVSNAVKQSFGKLVLPSNRDKLHVIHDGIDIHRLDGPASIKLREKFNIPKDKLVIGNIANHWRAKDLKALVGAAHHLVHVLGKEEAHFVQIGAFTKHTEGLKKLSLKLQIDQAITFTDKVPNANNLMPQFDIYAMSSVREGLPLTVYEALYHGIPVVSTEAGGIPEAISNGFNGFLSPVKNPQKLATNLCLLMEDPSLRTAFAERSYQKFQQNFTSGTMAKNHLRLYRDLLKRKVRAKDGHSEDL